MTNDFDQDDSSDFDDNNFDEFENENSLGELWRNNPLIKIGVILAGVATIIFGIIILGSSDPQKPPSYVGSGSEVTEAPGTSEINPAYKAAVDAQNKQNVIEARRQGTSALPILTDTVKGDVLVPSAEEDKIDPLAQWRRAAEQESFSPEVQVEEPVEPPPQGPQFNPQLISELSSAMAQQMQSILAGQVPQPSQILTVTAPGFFDEDIEGEFEDGELEGEFDEDGEAIAEILVPAGTILYAQTLTEANTDSPGPVLAQIASPSHRGSRLIGDFDFTDDYILLNFHTIVIDGISYPVDAVAIDPNSTLPGLATEVDKRYLQRIILPAAAAFVEGVGRAIAEENSTNVTVNNETVAEEQNSLDTRQELASGFEEGADELGEIFDDIAGGTVPLIRVATGTPIGILFIEAVVDEEPVEEDFTAEDEFFRLD